MIEPEHEGKHDIEWDGAGWFCWKGKEGHVMTDEEVLAALKLRGRMEL